MGKVSENPGTSDFKYVAEDEYYDPEEWEECSAGNSTGAIINFALGHRLLLTMIAITLVGLLFFYLEKKRRQDIANQEAAAQRRKSSAAAERRRSSAAVRHQEASAVTTGVEVAIPHGRNDSLIQQNLFERQIDHLDSAAGQPALAVVPESLLDRAEEELMMKITQKAGTSAQLRRHQKNGGRTAAENSEAELDQRSFGTSVGSVHPQPSAMREQDSNAAMLDYNELNSFADISESVFENSDHQPPPPAGNDQSRKGGSFQLEPAENLERANNQSGPFETTTAPMQDLNESNLAALEEAADAIALTAEEQEQFELKQAKDALSSSYHETMEVRNELDRCYDDIEAAKSATEQDLEAMAKEIRLEMERLEKDASNLVQEAMHESAHELRQRSQDGEVQENAVMPTTAKDTIDQLVTDNQPNRKDGQTAGVVQQTGVIVADADEEQLEERLKDQDVEQLLNKSELEETAQEQAITATFAKEPIWCDGPDDYLGTTSGQVANELAGLWQTDANIPSPNDTQVQQKGTVQEDMITPSTVKDTVWTDGPSDYIGISSNEMNQGQIDDKDVSNGQQQQIVQGEMINEAASIANTILAEGHPETSTSTELTNEMQRSQTDVTVSTYDWTSKEAQIQKQQAVKEDVIAPTVAANQIWSDGPETYLGADEKPFTTTTESTANGVVQEEMIVPLNVSDTVWTDGPEGYLSTAGLENGIIQQQLQESGLVEQEDNQATMWTMGPANYMGVDEQTTYDVPGPFVAEATITKAELQNYLDEPGTVQEEMIVPSATKDTVWSDGPEGYLTEQDATNQLVAEQVATTSVSNLQSGDANGFSLDEDDVKMQLMMEEQQLIEQALKLHEEQQNYFDDAKKLDATANGGTLTNDIAVEQFMQPRQSETIVETQKLKGEANGETFPEQLQIVTQQQTEAFNTTVNEAELLADAQKLHEEQQQFLEEEQSKSVKSVSEAADFDELGSRESVDIPIKFEDKPISTLAPAVAEESEEEEEEEQEGAHFFGVPQPVNAEPNAMQVSGELRPQDLSASSRLLIEADDFLNDNAEPISAQQKFPLDVDSFVTDVQKEPEFTGDGSKEIEQQKVIAEQQLNEQQTDVGTIPRSMLDQPSSYKLAINENPLQLDPPTPVVPEAYSVSIQPSVSRPPESYERAIEGYFSSANTSEQPPEGQQEQLVAVGYSKVETTSAADHNHEQRTNVEYDDLYPSNLNENQRDEYSGSIQKRGSSEIDEENETCAPEIESIAMPPTAHHATTSADTHTDAEEMDELGAGRIDSADNSRSEGGGRGKKILRKNSSILDVMGVSTMQEALLRIESLGELAILMRQAGLEHSNLIFGIDYTASNKYQGEKSFGGRSLHGIYSDRLNPYQQVIRIVGDTLAPFATSGQIPVFGFGDVYTSDWSVFPLKQDIHCSSFDEVLDVYNRMTPHVILSGPTNFAPLIYQAIDICSQLKGYHILVIVADGQVTNERATRRAIVDACQYPLSIIVVGVGDGPWDMMRVFDDSLPKRPWDNFHFCEFHEVMKSSLSSSSGGSVSERAELSFAVHTLLEIPDQYQLIKRMGLLNHDAPAPAPQEA